MATFQQYPGSFLVDSTFFQNNNVSTIKAPGVLDEYMPIHNSNNLYSTFETNQEPLFAHNNQEGSSIDVSAHESNCLEQQNIAKSCSLTEKNRTESGEQVTQNCADKKRKSRKGSSSTSVNSKEVKQVKSKKKKEDKEAKNDKKNDNKAIEEPPKGYIHVRARRGQATDSHSLAERVRREKISERMKMLQALVPGCDKVTGKALMLDEIINYVQSLQNQVEFLSMKLASLDPMVYTVELMDHDPMLFGTQDAGSVCWGVNEQQRRSIINQFGLFSGTNLYSLQ